MANPHDQFFCSVFQHRTEARGLLQTVLPPRLVGSMSMRSIHASRSTLGDRRLSGRTTDLLLEVGLAKRALVLFLVEHQSSADAIMPARMFGYVSRVVDRWMDEQREQRVPVTRVPPVFPVLVSQRPEGWNSPRALGEIWGVPAGMRAAARGLLPELRMIVLDLGRKSELAIERARASAFTRLALLMLKDAWHPDLLGQLRRRESLLRGAYRERGPEALELLSSYALQVGEVEPRRLGDVMARVGGAEAKEKVMTTAEKLRREGKREGKREGRREGLRERQEDLLVLLAHKFGPLTKATTELVRQAGSPQLTQWFRRALTATSLDAVFE